MMPLSNASRYTLRSMLSASDHTTARISVSVQSGDPCPGTGTLTATFDPPSLFYNGTWTRNDCSGPSAGVLIGARATSTRSDHVLQILDRLSELADRFESGVPFGSSHPAVSSGYLDFGRAEGREVW